MKIDKKIRKTYDRKTPSNDYLKYWRVVRYWVKAKYGLTTPDLEMLLFLYSEQIFTKDKFSDFKEIMSWDKNRFERLRQEGWIIVWKKREGKNKALYEVSHKGKKVIGMVYKKLNGEEISERNPLFLKSANYMDKVYRNMIIEMNKSIKRQRHLSQE
jgi:hypothetical protein